MASFQKNGGSTRHAAHPACTPWRVSAMVSGNAAQPVAATRRSPGMPPASNASMPASRSATENDWPSPVVPNGATPSTPRASNDLRVRDQHAMIDAARCVERGQHRAPQSMHRRSRVHVVLETYVVRGFACITSFAPITAFGNRRGRKRYHCIAPRKSQPRKRGRRLRANALPWRAFQSTTSSGVATFGPLSLLPRTLPGFGGAPLGNLYRARWTMTRRSRSSDMRTMPASAISIPRRIMARACPSSAWAWRCATSPGTRTCFRPRSAGC